jgi:hypothetical protein
MISPSQQSLSKNHACAASSCANPKLPQNQKQQVSGVVPEALNSSSHSVIKFEKQPLGKHRRHHVTIFCLFAALLSLFALCAPGLFTFPCQEMKVNPLGDVSCL